MSENDRQSQCRGTTQNSQGKQRWKRWVFRRLWNVEWTETVRMLRAVVDRSTHERWRRLLCNTYFYSANPWLLLANTRSLWFTYPTSWASQPAGCLFTNSVVWNPKNIIIVKPSSYGQNYQIRVKVGYESVVPRVKFLINSQTNSHIGPINYTILPGFWQVATHGTK